MPSEDKNSSSNYADEAIDGLRVIMQRRGCKIQEGDVLACELAIHALMRTSAKSPSSLAKQEPRGAVPLTEEEIRQIEDDIRAGLPVGITRTITLCKMAVNGLLYGEEINRLRSAPLPSVVACKICNGTGQVYAGNSGLASDGNAPLFDPCPECAPAATARPYLQECLDAIDAAQGAKAMPDSPTPRTDTAVSCGYDDRNALVVMTKLSRQLERELAESERERKIAVKQCWDTETELTSSASACKTFKRDEFKGHCQHCGFPEDAHDEIAAPQDGESSTACTATASAASPAAAALSPTTAYSEQPDERIREAYEFWAGRQNLSVKRKGGGYSGPYTEWCWNAFYAATRLQERSATPSATERKEYEETLQRLRALIPGCDCDNPVQCWEQCGTLGHSEKHVRVIKEG